MGSKEVVTVDVLDDSEHDASFVYEESNETRESGLRKGMSSNVGET